MQFHWTEEVKAEESISIDVKGQSRPREATKARAATFRLRWQQWDEKEFRSRALIIHTQSELLARLRCNHRPDSEEHCLQHQRLGCSESESESCFTAEYVHT